MSRSRSRTSQTVREIVQHGGTLFGQITATTVTGSEIPNGNMSAIPRATPSTHGPGVRTSRSSSGLIGRLAITPPPSPTGAAGDVVTRRRTEKPLRPCNSCRRDIGTRATSAEFARLVGWTIVRRSQRVVNAMFATSLSGTQGPHASRNEMVGKLRWARSTGAKRRGRRLAGARPHLRSRRRNRRRPRPAGPAGSRAATRALPDAQECAQDGGSLLPSGPRERCAHPRSSRFPPIERGIGLRDVGQTASADCQRLRRFG